MHYGVIYQNLKGSVNGKEGKRSEKMEEERRKKGKKTSMKKRNSGNEYFTIKFNSFLASFIKTAQIWN